MKHSRLAHDQHPAWLLNLCGSQAKAVVREHNTHIKDARGTDMADEGMINAGQLAKEPYSAGQVFAVGFGSYQSSVMAGKHWGGAYDKLRLSYDVSQEPVLQRPWDHRAIVVGYHPERDRFDNYVPGGILQRYDAFVFLPDPRRSMRWRLLPIAVKLLRRICGIFLNKKTVNFMLYFLHYL